MHRIEAYITLATIMIAILSILYLPILFFLKKRGKGIIRQLSYLALFCSVFLILFATIFFVLPITFRPDQYVLNLRPFQWLSEGNASKMFIVEVIPNVMMFIPLGIFMPIVFRKMRRFYVMALVTFLVTFGIEFFQYFIGRSADIDDTIANLLGGIIGYGIFKVSDQLFQDRVYWDKLTGKFNYFHNMTH